MRTARAARAPAPERATVSSYATRMSLADALALGPETWETLEGQVASPSPFMSWAWHRAWADADADAALSEALVLRDGAAVQAILPVSRPRILFHRVPVRALTWAIGDLGCPDHLDLLAAAGTDLVGLAPILEELDWEILVLSNLAPGATAARRLGEALAVRGHTVQLQPLWACPSLELPSDWESYLASVTRSRRQALRYMEKNLRRKHAVTITDYDGERVEEGWQQLVSLHERRWAAAGETGAFRDPRLHRLHRRFAGELARRGRLWLTTLDIDGVAAAAWYGFTDRDTVYFYQSGRDPQWDRESVGQVLLAMMIRRGMERGFKRFDFLRGEDPYKRLWTSSARVTEELTVVRRGLRGRWLRGVAALAELRARFRRPGGAHA